LFDSRCGAPARGLVDLTPVAALVLKGLCLDTLACFRPRVRWNGIVQGTLETLSAQLLALRHVTTGAVRADYLVAEVVLVLAVAPQDTPWGLAAVGPCGGAAALLGRTLLEVCKLDKLACDPIAVGIEVLYQRLGTMDDASAWQLSELLAHHLNNTKFRWPFWRRWAAALAEAEEDDEEETGEEERFLRHSLCLCAHLNQSTPRLTTLLASLGAELPDPIARMLPPPLAPDTPVVRPQGLDGVQGHAYDEDPGALGSLEAVKVAKELRDRLRMMVELADKRRYLAAEGVSSNSGRSAEADLIADLVENQLTSTEAEVQSGRKPPHWRLTALAHALLAAGSASALDLTLTLGQTLALFDANMALMRRLLATSATTSAEGMDDDDAAVPGEEKLDEDAVLFSSCDVLCDVIASVWAKSSPGLASALVLALADRSLLPPDKVLMWMARTPSPLGWGKAHESFAPLGLALDLLKCAAMASEGHKESNAERASFLGDCAVSALDALNRICTQATDGQAEGQEAEARVKAATCAARAVARAVASAKASQEAGSQGGPLVSQALARSVAARVSGPGVHCEIKAAVKQLEQLCAP